MWIQDREKRGGLISALRDGLIRSLVPLLLIAGSPSRAAEWPKNLSNPAADKGDLILPMPCGGAMAFRKVLIPNQGPLNDYGIVVGGDDADYAYAEHPRPAQIAGSFDQDAKTRYYLIGKYEVNRAQYAALGSQCQAPADDQRLPQTDVTWLEAMAFADRYTQWLLKNAADKLPKDGQQPGFLRLPTEVEWEFAARGGLAVPVAQFRERTFPMEDEMVRYVWFEGTESANGKPQPIGMLKPNPLGLHDVLGNADEMVFDPYRLNRLDRLHGQAGGFVVRGGNYFTPQAEVRTAQRIEVPFYVKGEPRRAETTGFRLVVTVPVESSREKLRLLRESWNKLGSAAITPEASPGQPKSIDAKGLDDPVAELGVISDAAQDANMKNRLRNVQNRLKVTIQERDDQRKLAAKAALRLGAFLCQKMGADGKWVDAAETLLKQREAAFGADDPGVKSRREQLKGDRAALTENLLYYSETILGSAAIYDGPVLGEQFEVLKTELELKNYQALLGYADTYYRQLTAYRGNPAVRQNAWLNDCKALNKK
ncbi:formylglycine-generating enzyme family protein [Methylococcus mesophilus]|uniref:formylglycine-generating enzyme family protein n=1 Tax=Methylococcus mesophilus TaxID=2993564 RepID=UPI00224B87BD|nr:SUMF1/EgtB/PvdO family nonheme iron enzyme [Methylococcus mesophilus]UZR28943.1 SUMF1/EgtB/PvdO family nonheme iron enzyme [Methylococcus mesophilus]